MPALWHQALPHLARQEKTTLSPSVGNQSPYGVLKNAFEA